MLAVILALIFFLLFKSFRFVFNSRRNARLTSTTNTANMGSAIRDGFRSAAYPFLETLTPTDLDPDRLQSARLSRVEKAVLTFKKTWLATPYPDQLAAIIARIVEDRNESPISNVVCLGIGGEGSSPTRVSLDVQQFVVLSQIIAQLAVANPELLSNIYVQDPLMMPEMKALFLNHGCQVVESPAAFKLVGANTFLISAFVCLEHLFGGLKGQPTEELAMFMGNGEDLARTVRTASPNIPEDKASIPAMFDTEFTNHQDVPCDRCNGKLVDAPGNMKGLSPFEIWWRPIRTDEQRFEVRFDAARELGFSGDVEEFKRAYDAGYSKLNQIEQHRFIYNFMSTVFNKSTQSMENDLLAWVRGKTDDHKKYEKDVNRFLSILYDPGCEDRTFIEYLNGFREI
ncbi:uncharacterized protein PAC_00513 [Phialocephala subalpina]|uniref:SRR1-like domain-containing protein n=1 Tax=Phialocephala subalpina TaxID=576137 RepID=A0A1L7WD74_9HELO|nr:uncharacterized protein PAC_00513 [Phialocephala subalpina]